MPMSLDAKCESFYHLRATNRHRDALVPSRWEHKREGVRFATGRTARAKPRWVRATSCGNSGRQMSKR